ncbi:hypothetical protein [Halostella litorea]|uniref:hypothetical protein n=1 Tax=Halostella litorea TaxID=2528831 RepID=UPI0013866363|nr:hypothetical protein [Halostella litorea]
MSEDDDRSSELSLDSPFLLFNLFQSDVIAAEVDWENERFVFYPVNSIPVK